MKAGPIGWLAVFAVIMSAAAARAAPSDKTILILFNHGTSKYNDCLRVPPFPPLGMPRWVREIRGRKLKTEDGQKFEIKVVFVCSNRSPGKFDSDKQACDLSVCRRVRAISREVEEFAKTYPRRQIFLAGHSAGAWSSLLIKRYAAGAVNGLILSAPAFGGVRFERTCVAPVCTGAEHNQRRRMQIRAHHDKHIVGALGGPSLEALVAAFPCDKFGWPSELPFGPAQGAAVHVFPPIGPIGQPLACGKRLGDRHYNDAPRRFCEKIKNRSEPGVPVCSVKRIAYCPKAYQKLCEDRSHLFHDDISDDWKRTNLEPPVFLDWFLGTGVVLDFIRQRLANWAYGDGEAIKGDACGFMTTLAMCKLND